MDCEGMDPDRFVQSREGFGQDMAGCSWLVHEEEVLLEDELVAVLVIQMAGLKKMLGQFQALRNTLPSVNQVRVSE